MRADPNAHFWFFRPSSLSPSRLIAASAFAAAALATGGLTGTPSASAEAVLTLHIEEQTSWVQNFNPFDLAGRRQSTMEFIYEPLVIFNADQGGKPIFRLATGMKFSDDLKALTFTMREGVKWSDGKPLTVEDVKYSLDLMLQNPAVDTIGAGALINSVEIVSPTEIKLNLKDVDTQIPETLQRLPVVPAHIWKDIKDPLVFPNEKPVGSGPMTEVRRFTPQVYEQCRNPHYWDTASLKVDCLKFPQIAGNEQMLAYLPSGELDWFGSFLPDIEKTYVALDPEHNGYWQPPDATVSYQMNLKTDKPGNAAAFNDLAFRRAFSLSLDRKAMVDIAGYGYPKAAEHASGLPPRFEAWRNPEAEKGQDEWMAFDVDKANKVLDEAGYKKGGDGFRATPKGEAIAFAIIVPNGWTDWIDAAQIAVEGLRKAGVNASVTTPEYEQWRKQIIEGSFDVVLQSRQDGATPFTAFYNALAGVNAGRTAEAASRYQNAELDTLFAEFRKATDEAKRHELFDKIQLIVADNMPVVPAYNGPIWYQYSNKRFTGWVTKDEPVMNPEDHDLNSMRLIHLLRLKPVQ